MRGYNARFISQFLATEFKYHPLYMLCHILLKVASPLVLGWIFGVSWIQVFLGHYSTFSVPQSKIDLSHLSKEKKHCCSHEVKLILTNVC